MKGKILLILRILRYLPWSLYFNFKYLPASIAIHLPIVLYKPHLLKCRGSIRLEAKPRFAMWKLGFPVVSIFPNTGVTWENRGGTIILKGKGLIGNDSYLSFGEKTTVIFGNSFVNSAGMKLVSYRGIDFGENTRLGWSVVITDNNFHMLYDMEKKVYKRASAPIEIGPNNWFASYCKIMPGTVTPERCIFGMGTIVTRGCVKESYCLMGGSPVRVLTRNIMRDFNHDREEI